VYVFPGIGLGAFAVGARRVTDSMLTAAAHAIGAAAPIHSDPRAGLLPAWDKLVDTATAVAQAVGRAAVDDGVAPELNDAEIDAAVCATRWAPAYPELPSATAV
jgi:malate dehydrogenase (oxaloacetate-decarboxylating)